MKTKLILLILCICLFTESTSAQITVQRTYGSTSTDVGYSCVQTKDGGYAITGYFSNTSTQDVEVVLIKTDLNGDTLWTRTYEGTFSDGGRSLQQTADSGYVIAGFSSGSHCIRLLKTDSHGDVQWTKNYGGTTSAEAEAVIQTSDGGYLISADPGNVYLIKTDSNGDTVWTRIYGGTGPCRAYSVQQTNDGGYIVSGYAQASITYGDFYLLKLNASGDSLWTRTYGGNGSEEAHSVKQTNDGGFIIAGEAFASFGAVGNKVYLVKTDGTGNVLWSWLYGGTEDDRAFAVEQTTDNGYIIAGATESFGTGDRDVYLLKTDSNGNLLWSKTFGGIGWDDARSVQQSPDGGYILGGINANSISGDFDVYLIKTDANGNTGCHESNAPTITDTAATVTGYTGFIVSSGIDGVSLSTITRSGMPISILCHNSVVEYAAHRLLNVYPNPFEDKFTLTGTDEHGIVILYEATGREILRKETTQVTTHLRTETLSPGIYIVRYLNADRIETGMVVKH